MPAPFSNYGPWVDCYAPGVNVTSAFIDWNGPVPSNPLRSETFKEWATWSGTSFAAPKVSGTIASMIGPATTAQQAANALVNDPARPWRPDYGRFLDF
jgi:subtilisin family serine protease